ncbi:SGS-domain-containing protein [Xylaria sp. FL1777]|nr:SGS-domain-containing protein [Xylaria sp. FL1777]
MSSAAALALADAGVRAVSAQKYDEGIAKLTEALQHRAAPLWYLERSKAYLRTKKLDAALNDAEMALHVAYERANRDHMMEAQLRRSITLFRMGNFADADVCAFWAVRLSDGARAHEDDGQQNKVDKDGNYRVELEEVKENTSRGPSQGLATALSKNKRSKDESLRNLAVTWRIQALTQMEKLPMGHHARKVHVTKYPNPSQTSSTTDAPSPASAADMTDDEGDKVHENTENPPDVTPETKIADWEKVWARYQVSYVKHNIRCSFYQSETKLTVDIFVKNLATELITVVSESQAVRISPIRGASLGGFDGSLVLLLFDEINPVTTRCTVKPMKIELVLEKKRGGRWPALRRANAEVVDNLSVPPSPGVSFDQFRKVITSLGFKQVGELELPDYDSNPSAWYVAFLEKLRSKMDIVSGLPSTIKLDASITPGSAAPSVNGTQIQSQVNMAAKTNGVPPAYPTSSRRGPQNWDKIDDDDNEDASKSGDVNGFFQQIYKDADEDTKRAMMKSFTESNGTALSTSWDDAKSKTYKTQPPDGAEAKKW